MKRTLFPLLGCVILAMAMAMAMAATGEGAVPTTQAVATAASQPAVVTTFGVYEVTLKSDAKLKNPFWDAAAFANFTSPTGKKFHVAGFYDGNNIWRIRFVPREVGTWSYAAFLQTVGFDAAILAQAKQSFECKDLSAGMKHGYLRPSTKNPFRMEYEDDTPFYGVGVQTVGPFTPDLDGPPAGEKWRTVPAAEWCEAFKGAANLVRIQVTQGTTVGMGTPLIPPKTLGRGDNKRENPKYAQILVDGVPDRYDLENAAKLDEVYKLHRAAGFSEMLTLFQDMSAFGEQETGFGPNYGEKTYKTLKSATLPLQEKYLRYIVARYGAFVDIWEIFNEDSSAMPDYLAHLHKVIREADPYQHIISSNFSLYDKSFCEIILPHEYLAIPASEVDAYLSKQIAAYKSFSKPIQYSEFGNKASFSNYDPVKWRVALWTAYMNEAGILYWSMSGNKTLPKENSSANANTYMGPETREHFRVFHKLTADLPQDMRPVYTHPGWLPIRTYALSNGKYSILYVHHYADHSKEYVIPDKTADGLSMETGPGTFVATWTDPATGKTVGETKTLKTEKRFLTVPMPPVTVDLVCRIERQDAK